MDGESCMNVLDQAHGDAWAFYNADCVDFAQQLPDNSVDFSVYSPPFSSLYIYSESAFDMGNVANDDEFFERYRFLVREQLRITRPGRLCAIHVKDLVYYQNSSERGDAGLRPFSDRCTEAFIAEGWTFHCRITIWRDPVLERSKTNAHGLLWKTFQKDSSFCRVGMPEYLLVFRKWAQPGQEGLVRPVEHPKSGRFETVKPWQELASPVWNYQPGQSGKGDMDLPATDVLNVKMAADPDAEKHLCPMPLNITRRALTLWSNEGDTIFSPFGGIGSEGVASIGMGRRFIGTELHPIYWKQGVSNLRNARPDMDDLFAMAGDA
jgi:DNA modification methylase